MTRSPIACPFCGHPSAIAAEIAVSRWSIACPECQATGPTSQAGLSHAVDLWNDRIPHRPPMLLSAPPPAFLCCGED